MTDPFYVTPSGVPHRPDPSTCDGCYPGWPRPCEQCGSVRHADKEPVQRANGEPQSVRWKCEGCGADGSEP
jgi:hypothetical protein